MYDNSVRLIGFLGKDAEKRTARNKTPYVILSLATTVRWRSKESQENVERTEWHRLVAWGNLAKFAGTLKRGNHISAEGELRYRIISDKDNSEVEHRLAEIHLAKIGKLDRSEQLTDELPVAQTDDQAA
jgi:single-strand DNA-binding protein